MYRLAAVTHTKTHARIIGRVERKKRVGGIVSSRVYDFTKWAWERESDNATPQREKKKR
jgi:hypothetical protein